MAEKSKAAPLRNLVSLWDRPGFLVRRLHQISVAIFSDEMAPMEVTPVQFGALSIIGTKPGIEQTALGIELGIDRANVSDLIARLAKSGHVLREASSEDRRAKRIFLTDHGAKVVVEANRRLKRIQERLLAPLTPKDRAIFVELLTQLVEVNNSLGRAVLRLEARS